MADTAILRPTSDGAGAGFSNGMGVWTRAAGRSAGIAYPGYDEASLDETDSGYAQAWTSASTYAPGRFENYFDAPPTGIAISSLTLKAYMRHSCAGPNYFAEAARMKGFVMIGATRYYQSGPGYVIVAEFCNRNTTPDAGTYGLYTVGVWATNPATGAAWTLADLAAGTFIAGVEAGGVAEGQAGNGIPPAYGGSTADFDLGQLWVEITTTPSETFVNPIRLSASAILRLFGRPLQPVEFSGPVQFSRVRPGETVYVTHPQYPTEDGLGCGDLNWQRRPLKVLSVSDGLEPPEVRIKALDIIDRACRFWSTWRTDVGADVVNLSGIPRFDQGGGYTIARTTADWVERPTDRLLVGISAARPRITPFGLLVQGGTFPGSGSNAGEYYSYFLNNSFSQGTGGHGTSVPDGDTTAFTSWIAAKAGGGSLYVWKDDHFRFDDPTAYARHAKMGSGANYAADHSWLYQVFPSHGANIHLRAQLLFSAQAPTLDPSKVSFILRRNVSGTIKDWSTAGWVVGAGWRTMVDAETASSSAYGKTSYRKYGNFYEYWTEEIDFGPDVGTLSFITCFVQQNNAGIYLHQAKLYHSWAATGQAQRVLRRVYDVTQGSNVTNAADVGDLNNDDSYRIALADHGTISFVFIPLWSHSDVYDLTYNLGSKYLMVLNHDFSNLDADSVYYSYSSATVATLGFARAYGGSAVGGAEITLTGSNLAQYMVPIKIAIRWTGAAGELGLAPKTLDIFVNGIKGTSGVVSQFCRQKATGAYVAIGRHAASGGPGSALDPFTFADGYFSDMEFRADVLSDVQIAALHARSGQNLPLPSLV